MRKVLGVVVLMASTITVSMASVAQAKPPADGPIELTGELKGAPYEIRVPAEWNGTLAVYAHGYSDAADHPGETENRTPQAFVNDVVEQQMLAAGYAVAGSAYASNGWAVADAIQDTKRLVNHFRAVVGQPEQVILVGFSMGSVVAFESIERFPDIYDGAIPSCAVGAGAPRAFDGTLAISLAYDAVFGWPAAWGTPGDVRDDLDFDSEVLPVLISQLTAPGGAARFEFMRLVVGVPRGPEWPFSDWFFTTEGRAELERRAGGPVVQNLDHTYALTDADRAYLAGLDLTLNAATLDGWLAEMSANRFAAPNKSRHYVEKYADYTGQLVRPVLTLHTVVDALVPPAHIAAYQETVAAAGSSALLAEAWTSGIGHCNFTPQQLVTAVDAMNHWISSGERPESFPPEQGFVAFDPPDWPQP